MKMDEEKRSAFAKRLKDLALHMYDAMSQGQHNTIFVTQEMADDVLTAAVFVNLTAVFVNLLKPDKDLE